MVMFTVMKIPTKQGRSLMQMYRVVPKTKRENWYMQIENLKFENMQ